MGRFDFNIVPSVTPVRATTDPTPRSIPPVRITIVTPTATVMFIEV